MDGVDAKASLGPHDARYRLDYLLGEGGMAVVWRGYDSVKQKLVAIKVVRGGGRATAVRVKRLTAELRALSRLESARHPNLVQVYAFHEFEDPATKEQRAFIVMEYVEGGNVEQQMHALGRLPPRRAVRWVVQVLSALGVAHRVNVVHRDIKPSNILLDREGNAVLADFGIAMFSDEVDRFTRTGVMMGSVAYAPPEQRLSAKDARPTSDLYATGAALYQMLTGERPDHLFAEPIEDVRWQLVDEPLRSVLFKAMKKDPDDRYQTADAMADALEACVASLPPDEVADALTRFPGRSADSRDGAFPTFGQTKTADGLPEFDDDGGRALTPARVALALGSVLMVVLMVWLTGPASGPPASAPVAAVGSATSVAPAADPSAVPPSGSAVAPVASLAQASREAVAAVSPDAPRARLKTVAPAPVSPEMAPIAGKWRRNGGSVGPSTFVVGGDPSALRGTFAYSRANTVVGEGTLSKGTWDPAVRQGAVEFEYAETTVRLDLKLMPDGTLAVTCCGGGAVNMGDIQYRRAE